MRSQAWNHAKIVNTSIGNLKKKKSTIKASYSASHQLIGKHEVTKKKKKWNAVAYIHTTILKRNIHDIATGTNSVQMK